MIDDDLVKNKLKVISSEVPALKSTRDENQRLKGKRVNAIARVKHEQRT